MLVLSRRESERIRLGDDIVVTVVRVSGDKVRLGIQAPPHVLVLREELEPHEQSGGQSERGPVDRGGAASTVPRAAAGPVKIEIEVPLAEEAIADETFVAGCA